MRKTMLENKSNWRYINSMKKIVIFMFFAAVTASLSAQADIFKIAPGAVEQLESLLNKPAMVKPALATPLGKNWFTLETDAHVFTEGVSVRQVADVFLDIENQAKFFDGKKSKITASRVNSGTGESLIDYVSISIIIGIQLQTPYRASVNIIADTSTMFALDIAQIPQNSESNGKIKNLYAPKYVEEITINGKKYTYIRFYTIMDINASILPGAKGVLEKNSGPTNEEALSMAIVAAKTK